jgi:hypothetical protein
MLLAAEKFFIGRDIFLTALLVQNSWGFAVDGVFLRV